MNHRITIAGAAVAFALGAIGAAAQETGTATTSAKPMSGNLTSISDAMLQNAAGDPKNWIHPNGNYANTRYYPGAQITAANVGKMTPKFVFQTAVLESMETAPIVINGVMFLTTSFNHVYAIDATTGEEFCTARARPTMPTTIEARKMSSPQPPQASRWVSQRAGRSSAR